VNDIVGLIPAAGGGTRMYPFSRAVPKEMYPIMGKAVIEHSIENLTEAGIKKIFMIVGYQKGALMDYIGDGSFYNVKVSYIYQLERRGLGHAILQGRDWINSTFVVLLGDSFIEPKKEINSLIELHNKKRPVASIMLFRVRDPTGYGIVKLRNTENGSGEIEKLIEKPDMKQAEEYKINGDYYAICGLYVFEPKIFKYIEKTPPGAKNEIQITDAVKLALENGEKAYGYVIRGEYMDIGRWSTVLNIEKKLVNSYDIKRSIKERNDLAKRISEMESRK